MIWGICGGGKRDRNRAGGGWGLIVWRGGGFGRLDGVVVITVLIIWVMTWS